MAKGVIRLADRAVPGERVILSGAPFSSLMEWKPRVGEAVTILDGADKVLRARVLEIAGSQAVLIPFEEAGLLEDAPYVILLQALPERERMELIIQKTTELGVSEIVPLKSLKSISIEEREAAHGKTHRWQDVALKAAKQSRGHFITEVKDYRSLEEALEYGKGADLKLSLWERPGLTSIKEALRSVPRPRTVAILSGPEGGFDTLEMEKAEKAGFVPVSLGRRILRAETAPIMAAGLVFYEYGR